MRRLAVGLLGCVLFTAGCTSKREAVQAAEPHLESFSVLRLRALKLLELKADIERKRQLVHALEHPDDPVPDTLAPVLEQLKSQNVQLDAEDVEAREELFSQTLRAAFAEDPAILQAEIVFRESNGEVSRFRDPIDSELPAGVDWHGLRQQRTFAGLAQCVSADGSEPCVLVQLRPRDYAGSAGLTVAFRRP